MRKRIIPNLLIFLVLSSCLTIVANSHAQDKQVQLKEREIAVLRAQLKTMQDYQDSLLSTVYWSLGLVAGITVILVGYNWFVNNKMDERDKNALKQELHGLTKSGIAEAQTALESNINGQLLEIKKEQREAIETSLKQAAARTDRKIDQLTENICALQYQQLESEARYWELKEVKSNELDRYLEMLPLAVESQSDTDIAQVLNNLLRLMKLGVFPWHGNNAELMACLDSLPRKFSSEIDAIKQILSEQRRKD